MAEGSPNWEQQRPERWFARDEFFKTFYGEVYRDCLDASDIEVYLRSKTHEAYLPLDARGPYLEKIAAAGLDGEGWDRKQDELLTPFSQQEQELIGVCVGFYQHYVPSRSETSVQFGIEEEELDALMTGMTERFRDVFGS